MANSRKWTQQEDERLLRQVRVFPQNLHKCFHVVAEEIDRTPGAVANHWYSVLSKKPGVIEFGTISSKHFARNRKNGMGVEISSSIWRRFLHLIRAFV